ncbi:MAG: exopolysaccharide biosynthesis polyprenyl glycosylphosphotransferase, partial [Bdellovibrionales bacterium]|nr:exopolysaccharide biosynthesis polyprenyl glycosylphosphotransferase [Bdellovibrionales bacterium]
MMKRYQNSAGTLTRIADVMIVVVAWLLAYPIRFGSLNGAPGLPFYPEAPEESKYLGLLPFIIVLWSGCFHFFGVYRFERVIRRSTEIHTLIRAHFATLILFTALTFFVTEYRFSRGVILIFGILVLIFSWMFRVGSRKVLRELKKKGIFSTRVIAVGEGRDLEYMVSQLGRYPELGLDVVRVIGPRDYPRALELIRMESPKSVLLGIPSMNRDVLDGLVLGLKDESLDLQIIPDYSSYLALGAATESFGGVPLIVLNSSPLSGYQAWLKRAMDFFLSGLGLLILSPVLLALGILVKLTSRGPVLYRQERMGLDGATFMMLKFRSMRVDAEDATGAVWARANDDRRTSFGTFLRSTSLDELPQLWNVFAGDMSLVGPRPERPVFVNKFRQEIPNYMLRHRVKTGITGWAQINGWRGDTSLEKRIECDIFYI